MGVRKRVVANSQADGEETQNLGATKAPPASNAKAKGSFGWAVINCFFTIFLLLANGYLLMRVSVMHTEPETLRDVNHLINQYILPYGGFVSPFTEHMTTRRLDDLDIHHCNIDRVPVSEMTRERFVNEYELPRKPVFITGVANSWPARERWTLSRFLNDSAGEVTVERPIGEDDSRIPLADYLTSYFGRRYTSGVDTSEFAIIDGGFYDHPKAKNMDDEYEVPLLVTEGDFFAELIAEAKRAPSLIRSSRNRKFLVAGPAGSGTNIHKDYWDTAFWNACIFGRKRWVVFHQREWAKVPEELQYQWEDQDAYSWFHEDYHKMKMLGMEYKECYQEPGDMFYGPGGTWHQVVNVEDGITATENLVTPNNFKSVFRSICWDPDEDYAEYYSDEEVMTALRRRKGQAEDIWNRVGMCWALNQLSREYFLESCCVRMWENEKAFVLSTLTKNELKAADYLKIFSLTSEEKTKMKRPARGTVVDLDTRGGWMEDWDIIAEDGANWDDPSPQTIMPEEREEPEDEDEDEDEQ